MLPNSDELVKGLRKKSISFTLHSGIRSLARLPGPNCKQAGRGTTDPVEIKFM